MEPRVLIVDDGTETRSILRRLLEEEGVLVVGEGGDGLEAYRLASELAPDVVLMDLSMPGMGGMEATGMIRQAMPQIQVVILTTDDRPHLTRCAEEAGAFAYLLKECPVQLILDAVRKAGQYKTSMELGSSPGM
jgi:pilus assembly protein CpaE